MAQGNKIFETYKELPSWAKGVVVVGGIAIAYIVGNTIYKKLFPTPPTQELLNVEDDITNFSKIYKQSFPDSAYDQYAVVIYNAQRTSFGNDSGTIQDTLKLMNNDLDVAKLIKSYGVRQDYAFSLPTDSYTLLGAAKKGISDDLFGAFTYRINDVNKDWASKGITYKL